MSYGIAFILRDVIGYRKQVVLTNIRNSFPEKSEAEIKQIYHESYRHLADRVVENLKCFSITMKEVEQRVQISNPEVLVDCYNRGQHLVMMVGHIATWEFGGYRAITASAHDNFAIVAVVSNPYFNRLIQRTRSKMGMNLVMMDKSKEFLTKPLTKVTAGIFISDQSPSNMKTCYWTTFLGQDTAFFTGAERYARMNNAMVIYPKITERSHGYFTAEIIEITRDPNSLPEFGVTEKFVRILEQQIRENPSDWLWSHKRWKHKRNKV
jgi:KDO2-lipid IV(A) lauroyltransferase